MAGGANVPAGEGPGFPCSGAFWACQVVRENIKNCPKPPSSDHGCVHLAGSQVGWCFCAMWRGRRMRIIASPFLGISWKTWEILRCFVLFRKHNSCQNDNDLFLKCVSDHITLVLKILLWLPLACRIKVTLCILAWKASHEPFPGAFQLSPQESGAQGQPRSWAYLRFSGPHRTDHFLMPLRIALCWSLSP